MTDEMTFAISIVGAAAITIPLVILDAKQKDKLQELKERWAAAARGLYAIGAFVLVVGLVTWAAMHFSGADSCGTHLVMGTLYTVVCK